jgi:D-alanyl-lipoteichoic acid acyltransferase DltB (MBOAT superfamily)
MTLASFQFLVFLAAVWLTWRHVTTSPGMRSNLLLIASYLFYGTWDVRFIPVLIATTVVQWWLGARISSSGTPAMRRLWLTASIGYGIGVLFYFKYAGFFVAQLSSLLSALGLASLSPVAVVAAPIGISFYTFLSLTYTIDIYRGQCTPVRSLRDFALYIAFFGHVTAGPISRARSLLPQLQRVDARASPLHAQAIFLIARGLVKKLVFSDVLSAEFVHPAFAAPTEWSSWFLVFAVFAYSLQIYMDVSGYTDIARGAARCFGYDLMLNFDRPYLARSVSGFWQRWHISVSSFFRDYLYFGLGGTRRGNVYLNLMLTFIAIGLWHGAGWNFVLYGCVHGSMVCIGAGDASAGGLWITDRRRIRAAATLATFLFVAFSRILFVSADLPSAASSSHRCSAIPPPAARWSAGLRGAFAAALLHLLPRQWEQSIGERFFRLSAWQQGVAYALAVVALMA